MATEVKDIILKFDDNGNSAHEMARMVVPPFPKF